MAECVTVHRDHVRVALESDAAVAIEYFRALQLQCLQGISARTAAQYMSYFGDSLPGLSDRLSDGGDGAGIGGTAGCRVLRAAEREVERHVVEVPTCDGGSSGCRQVSGSPPQGVEFPGVGTTGAGTTEGVDDGGERGRDSDGLSVSGCDTGVAGSCSGAGVVTAAKARRERRKRALARAQAGGCQRSGDGVEHRGTFALVDSSVRKELQETRAALLIAQNKRQLAVEESKASEGAGLLGALSAMRRTARVAREVQRDLKGTRAGSWVTEVAKVAQEAVASAVSDENGSIPTLEEFEEKLSGVAGSGGSSGCVSGTSLSVRQVEYDVLKRNMAEEYEEMPCVDPYEKRQAEIWLMRQYEDLFPGVDFEALEDEVY